MVTIRLLATTTHTVKNVLHVFKFCLLVLCTLVTNVSNIIKVGKKNVWYSIICPWTDCAVFTITPTNWLPHPRRCEDSFKKENDCWSWSKNEAIGQVQSKGKKRLWSKEVCTWEWIRTDVFIDEYYCSVFWTQFQQSCGIHLFRVPLSFRPNFGNMNPRKDNQDFKLEYKIAHCSTSLTFNLLDWSSWKTLLHIWDFWELKRN